MKYGEFEFEADSVEKSIDVVTRRFETNTVTACKKTREINMLKLPFVAYITMFGYLKLLVK